MYSQDLSAVVVDVGSLNVRAGYAGDDLPRFIIPSAVGKHESNMEVEEKGRYVVGDSGLGIARNNLGIQPVYRQGAILDFEDYEGMMRSLLTNEMRFNYEDYSFLLSEDNIHNKNQRQRIAEIFFDHLKVKNLFFCKNAVLSCFATGRSTAIVLDSGAFSTSAVTVHDGYALVKSSKKCQFGGQTLTAEIGNYLTTECGVNLNFKNSDRSSYNQYHREQLLRTIKQTIFRVDETGAENPVADYELPDRQRVKIDKSRLPDPFFGPYGRDLSYRGIHHLINDNINMCDIDIKKELYNNLIVTGGNSLLGGFMTKLQAKLTETIAPQKCKLISFPVAAQRKVSSWIGGSILASLSSFQCFWVGKLQWSQFGVSIIEKKCA